MNRIPYVIDNIAVKLVDVLNELLASQLQLDIATAYFSVRGFEMVRATLPGAHHFRPLLGDTPQHAGAISMQPNSRAYLRNELNAEPLTAATQRLVEELIRFLRRDAVEVRLYLGHAPATPGRHTFLHAKCYLVYGGRGDQQALFRTPTVREGTGLNPLVGIVILPKNQLLLKNEVGAKARRILARYDGVSVADSVGLGKTWIGEKLLEDYAYPMRQKALVICPASLRTMWQRVAARRDSIDQGSIRIFNLLEEVVVRRTRQFIRRAYPEATINGKTITWPARKLGIGSQRDSRTTQVSETTPGRRLHPEAAHRAEAVQRRWGFGQATRNVAGTPGSARLCRR